MRRPNRALQSGALLLAATLSIGTACSSSDPSGSTNTNGETSFSGDYGWTCPSGQNCQDVFNFVLTAGSTVNIQVTSVSSGSVSQLALYGPGVALGGVNLLTGTTNELRCNPGQGCSDFTGGEQVSGFTISTTGTYRLAVTRDWGNSCGGNGTYHLAVTSTKSFQAVGQTSEDTPSAATGYECH